MLLRFVSFHFAVSMAWCYFLFHFIFFFRTTVCFFFRRNYCCCFHFWFCAAWRTIICCTEKAFFGGKAVLLPISLSNRIFFTESIVWMYELTNICLWFCRFHSVLHSCFLVWILAKIYKEERKGEQTLTSSTTKVLHSFGKSFFFFLTFSLSLSLSSSHFCPVCDIFFELCFVCFHFLATFRIGFENQ